MTQYRKKPIVVEGIKFDGTNHDEIVRFAGLKARVQGRERALIILTEEGPLTVAPGDTVIKGIEGEFYPVKESVFPKTFEKVEQQALGDNFYWFRGEVDTDLIQKIHALNKDTSTDSEGLANRLEGVALTTEALMFQAAAHIRSLHKTLAALVEQIDIEQGIMTHDKRVNSKLLPTLDNAIDLLEGRTHE